MSDDGRGGTAKAPMVVHRFYRRDSARFERFLYFHRKRYCSFVRLSILLCSDMYFSSTSVHRLARRVVGVRVRRAPTGLLAAR